MFLDDCPVIYKYGATSIRSNFGFSVSTLRFLYQFATDSTRQDSKTFERSKAGIELVWQNTDSTQS